TGRQVLGGSSLSLGQVIPPELGDVAPPQAVQRGRGRDARDPWREPPAQPEGRQPAKGTKERFLRDFFHLLRTPEEASDDREHNPLVAPNQVFEGRLVARQHPLNQIRIVIVSRLTQRAHLHVHVTRYGSWRLGVSRNAYVHASSLG